MLSPDLNGTTSPCTPRPAKKRSTSLIATPGIDHQAKRHKMESQIKQGAELVEREEREQSNTPIPSKRSSVKEAGWQSPREAGNTSLGTQQDPNVLVANYEKEMDDLKAQVADLQAKMHHLEAQIPIKDKQLQDLKDFIAVQHLQPDLKQGPDDTAVTSKFSALRYIITNLTLSELNGQPFYKPTKTDHKTLFARLTATEQDYKEYLGSPDGFKAFFFEGVIWTKLIDRLLSSPLSAYLDMEEKVIRDQVYVHSGASPQKFHAWRAYTADFLEDAFGPQTTWNIGGPSRTKLVEDLVELLSRYSVSGDGNTVVLTREVDNIVEKAVYLACAMAKSRAYWVCSIPTCPQTKLPHGFVYQRDLIDVNTILQGGRQNVVDLVGRPSLLKFGDDSGEQYDTRIVVEKASALVFGKKSKKADPNYIGD